MPENTKSSTQQLRQQTFTKHLLCAEWLFQTSVPIQPSFPTSLLSQRWSPFLFPLRLTHFPWAQDPVPSCYTRDLPFLNVSQSDLSHQQVSSLQHLLPSGYLPSISTLLIVNWLQRLGHICCLASFSSVQLLSHVWLFVTPWTTACQASLSITNSRNLLKLTSIESVMPSNHLILCCPLLLLPSILPSIRIFSNESILRIR